MPGTNDREEFCVQHVGARLRSWRQAFGKKAGELAREVGISAGSLSEIENGRNAPSAKTLAALARHADVDLNWLLTGQVKPGARAAVRPATLEDVVDRLKLLEDRLVFAGCNQEPKQGES